MSPIPEDFEFLFVMPNLPKNSLALHVHGFGVVGGNGKVVIVPPGSFHRFSRSRVLLSECTFEWREKWLHNGKVRDGSDRVQRPMADGSGRPGSSLRHCFRLAGQ